MKEQEGAEEYEETRLEENMKVNTTRRYKNYVKQTKLKFPAELFKSQITKAIKALKQHSRISQKNSTNILETGDDDFLYLNIVMAELPADPPAPCGIGIKLPNAIYGDKYSTRACLIMKDPVDREVKEQIAKAAPQGFSKVIGYSKLMKNYNQYKDKRALLQTYDLFFADIRIFKMLPKCLGKVFIQAKKYPAPLKLHKPSSLFKEQEETKWSQEAVLKDVFSQTYFQLGNGPNYAMKVARVSMSVKESLQNVLIAIYRGIPHILVRGKGIKHNRIQQLSLKTKNSIELPIYNHLLKSELEAYAEYKAKESEEGQEDVSESKRSTLLKARLKKTESVEPNKKKRKE